MVNTLLNKPKDPQSNKPSRKKFMFDMNIFDEPEEEEIPEEPPPPPPPSFSEEELEAARHTAFEEGRKQGIQESLQSREEKLALLVARITDDCHKLFAQEMVREKLYEEESVRLARAIFQRLFPLYHAKTGFEEMKAVLDDILARQEGQAEILIEASPSQTEGVESHLAGITALSRKTIFKVSANESLQEGECKLTWTNGGALYNANALAGEIHAILEEALAITSANGHDKEVETDQSTPSDNDPQEQP